MFKENIITTNLQYKPFILRTRTLTGELELKLRPFYHGEIPHIHWSGPERQSEHDGEEKNILPVLKIEARSYYLFYILPRQRTMVM
jgi:hypothetical protein